MKKIFLISFLLIGLSINAQYFHNRVGTTNDDATISGISTTTNPNGAGQAFAGETTPSTINSLWDGIIVTSTDINGVPHFTNEFLIYENNGDRATYDPHIFEFDNSITGAVQEFGVVGRYVNSSGIGELFYMVINQLGVVTSVIKITTPQANYDIMDIGGIAMSQHGTNVYITGTARNTSGTTPEIFAIMLDYTTGTLVWSHVYSVVTAGIISDISPQAIAEETASGNEVAIAGYLTDVASGSIDGFTVVLDRFTGAAVQAIHHWGTSNSDDRFYSIIPSEQNLFTQNPTHGYVLGGHTDLNANQNQGIDQWVLRSDPGLQGAALWTTTFNNGVNTTADDYCYQVVERLNTSRQNEYFAIGNTSIGFYGGNDVLVNKIDWTGVPVSMGQFMYGSSGDDYGVAVDFENAPLSPPGLNIFGTWGGTSNIGGTEKYIVRAYLNGYSCDEYITGAGHVGGPDLLGGLETISSVENFVTSSLQYTDATAQDDPLCSTTSNPNGSNARIAPEEPEGEDESTISPNPLNAGTYYAGLEVEVDEPTAVTVSIYDMLGRSYFSHNFNLIKGKNNLTLDISKANMAIGMYSVRVQGKNYNKTIMLMVK